MTTRDSARRATPRPDISDPMPPGARSKKRRAIRDLVAKTEEPDRVEAVRGGGTGDESQGQSNAARPYGLRPRGRGNQATGGAVHG